MAKIDEEVKTTFENDKHRMMANLLFTANYIQRLFEEQIRPFGVSSKQFNILRILRGAGDWVNMNDVKKLMIQKSPNATRLCDKLLAKSLIERMRGESDRRVVYLKITKEGLDLLDAVDAHDDGRVLNTLESISAEEARLVSDILDKMRN